MTTAAGAMATASAPDEAAIGAATIRRIPIGPPPQLAALRRFPAGLEATDAASRPLWHRITAWLMSGIMIALALLLMGKKMTRNLSTGPFRQSPLLVCV